jgi:hypothetical protein
MRVINWPVVTKIGLQGLALLILTFGVTWSGGAEWGTALKSAVGVAAGWLLGHLQRTAGGVAVDLSSLKKDGNP